MPLKLIPQRTLIDTAETLAIALAGGMTFIYLGLPAALVSGSVVAVGGCGARSAVRSRCPWRLARFCYVIVGILLGAVVTPETLRGVTQWPISIALLVLASISMTLATMAYLHVVHRWDLFSALMGASPGALGQVIALSTELGGDLRGIAVVQTVRVLLLVVGLPNGLALFGLVVPADAGAARRSRSCVLGQMIVLTLVATACAVAFCGSGFPAG